MPRSSGTLSQASTSRATARNGVSQSQQQQTPPSQQNGTADAELDQLVINMVKVVLNMSVNKHPIKKPELVKNALAGNSRMFPKVYPLVVNELSDVYGYKLIEAERNRTFLLISNFACGSVLDLSEDYRRKYTLLYLILGYIFMKNGSVPEPGLWDFLAKLNICEDEEHRYFGNVRKLVNETFVKQAYLARTKQVVEGMSDDRFFFGWGVRAEHELSKKDILESICKLMGKPSICYITQHTAAYGVNDEEDDSMDASQA